MDRDEVMRLANLARIHLEKNEAERLSKEFENVLSYLAEIKEAKPTTAAAPNLLNKNQMREDTNPHEGGKYSEALLREAPKKQRDYIKVKKIL